MSRIADTAPGSATRLAPRAFVRTDAPSHDLNGLWRFVLHAASPTDGTVPPFAQPSFDDAEWCEIAVPSHWALQGHGHPTYTNIQYPFPIDPPHVPDANPTGDYRRTFVWTPQDDERVVLRFDGVESHATVWVNGTEVGWFTGSRLATEFDISDEIVAGENTIAVRVHQWSAASYLEGQDQWWLPGIFRDVTLLRRPVGGIDDVFLRADYDPVTRRGVLSVEVVAGSAVTVRVPEFGVELMRDDPATGFTIDLGVVQPWSAEQPRLYDVEVSTMSESVALRAGFRRIEIVGDQLLANGIPLIFRGVNRHETNPDLGRVYDEEYVLRDLHLMKRSNINAIRTAHQPPHPRLLELADELGFWVVLECDLETHGFWDVDWHGNPADEPAWREACLDRVRRTVERDKNHACVVLWSLGNEAGTGRNLAEMASWIRGRDRSRPIHYEGDYEGAYTDVYSRMYPTFEEVSSVCGTQTMPVHEIGPAAGARQRSKPFLMCEYGHAMGNGPGALADYEELVERYPRLHGGFIWEWRDHGLRTRTADGVEYFAYGGDFGEPLHDGTFIMDGLVLSDGTPSPALGELAAVWAPVRLTLGADSLVVENRRHDADTGDLAFEWLLEEDGIVIASGVIDVDPVPAGGRTEAIIPSVGRGLDRDDRVAGRGERWLNVIAVLAQDAPWAQAGHVLARSQCLVEEPAPPLWMTPAPSFSHASFTESGELASWRGIAIGGPRTELWRAPTENDRGDGQGSYETADPVLTHGRGDESTPASAVRWLERGLDRLTHRTVSVDRDGGSLVRRVRTMAAHQACGVESTFAWTERADGLHLRWDARPFGAWDCTWPRIGLHFELPLALADSDVEWFGTGPAESYSDSAEAARVGRFRSSVESLSVAYARPQETGHRPGLREMIVGPLEVHALPVGGMRPGFQLALHDAQERSRVGHAYELAQPRALHLYVDAAQHGLGSRACGPDVLPRHALWPRAVSFELVLR